MSPQADVVVLGGGPAGLSAAITLARQGRSVVVLDRRRKNGPRVGETLGPEVRPLLNALGIGEAFAQVASVPFVGTRSAWGETTPFERAALFNPLGEGWHIDRAQFDGWLTAQATQAGVVVQPVEHRAEVRESASGWAIGPDRGEFYASYLIEARGRGASGLSLLRRWVALDRLVGVVGWFREPPGVSTLSGEPELLIEAISQGWWYSARQPGGGMVATWMTDADLLDSSGREGLAERWRGALAAAPLTMARLQGKAETHPLEVRRAESGYSWPDRGRRWRAVGDAAFARDPLAGTGIASALRSGVEAARDIHRELEGESDEPQSPPAIETVTAYLEQRARYYGMERRWPDSLFWRRRQPLDLAAVPLLLDPEAILARTAQEPSVALLAPAETLLPPRAVRDFLRTLDTPTVAHTALAALREKTGPSGDLRLIVAVQLLMQADLVQVAGGER